MLYLDPSFPSICSWEKQTPRKTTALPAAWRPPPRTEGKKESTRTFHKRSWLKLATEVNAVEPDHPACPATPGCFQNFVCSHKPWANARLEMHADCTCSRMHMLRSVWQSKFANSENIITASTLTRPTLEIKKCDEEIVQMFNTFENSNLKVKFCNF